MVSLKRSRDGWEWIKGIGLSQGVPSRAVISPPSNISPASSTSNVLYDVVVVGGGYTGLTAVRDLTTSGLKTLLLEGRDRIGGRSWSADIEGYPYEMGGTWVHWGQAHVWREISRYNMRSELEISQSVVGGENTFSLASAQGPLIMSHTEEDAFMESALNKFADVDGKLGRVVLPYPHDAGHNPDVWQYDKMTCRDRINLIADSLSADEKCALEGYLLMTSGGTIDAMSFFEFLHWWGLCGYNYLGCIEYLIKYKFRHGQSSFAIKFWKEALATGNLRYAFNKRVSNVTDNGSTIELRTADGSVFRARRVIFAVGVNVLKNVSFSPALSEKKTAAISIGHLNQCTKVHAEVNNKELRSWSGINHDRAGLIYSFGDGTTPAGRTHIVAFGADKVHLDPEENIQKTLAEVTALRDMDVHRLVFHNWSKDDFAKGAWFFPGKEFVSKYHEDLRARHGAVLFANSDWAVGWRSFIDGAIEEGARAAFEVKNDLLFKSKPGNSTLDSETVSKL